MPEYDYGPEDIAHVEMTFDVYAEPDALVKVNYVVHLKNGETREEQSGDLTGMPAANAAIAVLEAKFALQTAQAPKADAHPWRQSRG